MTPAGQLAAAIDLLADIEADARPADAVANAFFRNRRFIGAGDRREVSTLVWGVLRARRHLGWWLEKFGAAPTPRLLLCAQAIFTGMTPNKIALAFTAGRYGPPPLSEAETIILEKFAGHTLEHPNMPDAVKYEIPDWILPRLQSQFGPGLHAEMTALATPAPLDLRINTLKTTREGAIAALHAEKLTAIPTPYSPWGLRLANRQSITAGRAFQEGLVEIQDEGSQLVALLAGAAPGMRVADYCAGAGGKTLAMAMMMENKGHIVACDVSVPRLEGAIKRLRRAGVHNAERHLLEQGDKWTKRQAEKFDRVLVDAPCTGTGTWRRNPDARLRLKENDLAEILPKQSLILDQAQKLLKPGGRLIYATCSLLQEENEMQVDAFLIRHPNFRLIPLTDQFPEALRGQTLRLTPLKHDTDGFFRRRSGARRVIVRPARPEDAAAIGAVHVASWRSTYAGILPDNYLARLSVVRQAHGYERMMRARLGVFVAVAERRVIGFTTATRLAATPLGDGEIRTLYVLDDFRERGFGRALLQAAGEYLAGLDCSGAFAWVLRDNPATYFYERVGGKRAALGTTHVAGTAIPQAAYVWNPIGKLLEKAHGVGEA